MTTSDEAYERFTNDFSLDEEGGFPGRTAAIRAGAMLIQHLASDEDRSKNPQVTAAEITAIGTMVGHYVGALSHVDLRIGQYSTLRLEGVHSSRFPSTIKVLLEQQPPTTPDEA